MRAPRAIGTIVCIALAAACGNTADGIKQDAAIAADKSAEAADAAGTKVEGALQTGEVKSALIADTRVGAGSIDVDTNEEIRTVTLNGSVKTEAEKILAEEVAVSKSNGYRVVNNLAIRP